jgi:hypothetical protein
MSKLRDLLYPLYLDVSIMMSCMASLAEIYTVEKFWKNNEQTATLTHTINGEPDLHGCVAQLVAASIKTSSPRDMRIGLLDENQILFKQVGASLLVRMRNELYHQGHIIYLDDCTQEEWDRVPPSNLVELSGEIHRSPLNEIAQLAKRFILVMQPSLPVNPHGQVEVANLNPYQLSLLQNMSLLQAIIADLEAAPLVDMVLKQQTQRWRRTAVLDLSTKVLPLYEQEVLYSGSVTVLGKVTRVLAPDDTINLYRRSILGTATRGILTQLAQSFNATPGISIQLGASVVAYPAIEIVPIAIYI